MRAPSTTRGTHAPAPAEDTPLALLAGAAILGAGIAIGIVIDRWLRPQRRRDETDPVLRFHQSVPEEDEELDEDERSALAAGCTAAARGEEVPWPAQRAAG